MFDFSRINADNLTFCWIVAAIAVVLLLNNTRR